MSMGKGDKLARGARAAQFETPDVSPEKWTEAFGEGETEIERLRRLRMVADSEEVAKVDEEIKREAEAAREEQAKKAEAPSKIGVRAIHDKIVVYRLEAGEEKIGRFYLPDESKEKPQEGVVIAVGPGRYVGESFVPVSVAVGETVLFGKYSGTEVKIGDKVYLILREEEILLVLTEAKDGEAQQPGIDAGKQQVEQGTGDGRPA